MFTFYRSPDYLAGMQILLNLSRDPATQSETAAALAEMSEIVPGQVREIFTSVGLDRPDKENLGLVIFEIVRGMSIGLAIEDAIHGTELARPSSHAEVLAEALASAYHSTP
jgi:hypothetical protein